MVVILDARDLVIGYGARVVGRGLSLSLGAGEVVALLGPNGGGKTTLLKTLLGLIPPLSGTVALNGRPLSDIGIRERARALGYVPQSHAGTFAFTAEDVVLMGRTAHSGLFDRPSAADRAAAQAALTQLGITHLAGRAYTEISGGERQLVLIARALAQAPAAIVLDEPTAALDFGNQGKVMAEVRRLAASGLGVLFTTHDPNHALRFADRAALIRDGRFLAVGPVGAVIGAERLAELYAAPIATIRDGAGAAAFLPG